MDNSKKTFSGEQQLETAALIEEASKAITKDEPFKLVRGHKNHFLPPYESISAFFGEKTDAKAIYEKVKTIKVDLPKISSSSLYEIGDKGVGKTVFKKFLKLLPAQLLYDFLAKQDEWLERAFSVKSNAIGWLACIKSFNLAGNQPDTDPQALVAYRNLSDFITLRCHQEIEFYESLKHKRDSNDIDLGDAISIWEKEIKPFYQQNTNISEDALNLISDIHAKRVEVTKLTDTQKNECIYHVLELEYDFLLNCIACYEVGYVAQDSDELKEWLISKTINVYTEPNNTSTCFRCLMDVLLLWLKEHDNQINQRQLASCVPIDFKNKGDEVGEEGKHDAQYNKLYKWYRSIDLPPEKSLHEFFNNLSQLSACPIDNGPFDVAKMAMGFDKALLEKAEVIKKEFGPSIDVLPIWKRLLGDYPNYYRYHCQQHSQLKSL